jgi:adenylate cyclase
LIDATKGAHIWSDRYDGRLEDIFDLQDRITESVVGAIQPSILLAEIERTKRERPESLDAYDYVLRALPYVWALDPTANAVALDHLKSAIEIEPDYPLALSAAAWCEARKFTYQWTPVPHEVKAEGLRLARLAGDMHNDDPLVLTMLCAAHSVVGDLDTASALIEKALALDPNSAMAWNRSGWVNVYLIRPEVAIENFQRAMRLSPFDPMNFNCFFGIGSAHFAAARYEDSLFWWRKGMLERPDLVQRFLSSNHIPAVKFRHFPRGRVIVASVQFSWNRCTSMASATSGRLSGTSGTHPRSSRGGPTASSRVSGDNNIEDSDDYPASWRL